MWQLLLLPACLAYHFVPTPPPPCATLRAYPVLRTVNVSVDHFDPDNQNTFSLRFYYGDDFPGKNIVVFIGGEWEINPGFITGGMAYDLAQQVGAGMFYVEHRYYGQSMPTDSATVEDLKYLSVEQALADIAEFLEYITSDSFENGRYKNGKVALFGCSYSATVATWMRLKYPQLVDAVFADSGPVKAQEDYYEYHEVATKSIRKVGGQACVDTVQQGIDGILTLLATPGGLQRVDSLFRTCTPLTSNSEDIISFLLYSIVETFSALVQGTEWDIPYKCDILTDNFVLDPVQRLANFIAASYEGCSPSSYKEVLSLNSNTSFGSSDITTRIWTYQTCTQFGWFQTTTSEQQMYGSIVPLKYYRKICTDLFNTQFTAEFINAGVDKVNADFGPTNIPDHVVSAIGELDPWGPVCAAPELSRPDAPVYVMDDTSHCGSYGPVSDFTSDVETKKRAILNDLVRFLSA